MKLRLKLGLCWKQTRRTTSRSWDPALHNPVYQLTQYSNVFLGRSLEKQSQLHPAIDAYKAATQVKPEDELAWKGLSKAYEALGASGVAGHTDAALGLAQVYLNKFVQQESDSALN